MDRPRAVDAVAAAEDEAADDGSGDPSVRDVDAARPAPRSNSSTPPPAPALRLDEIVAERTARGEPPGTADEDHLMEGRQESDKEDNEQAVASNAERSEREAAGRKRTRKSDPVIDPAIQPAIETDSDGSLKAPRQRKKDAKSRKRPRSPSPSDSSDSAEHRSGTSRHRPVTNSAIYNTYVNEGQILSDVRKRFQSIVFARDGSAPKTLTVHRALNFKATLLAAKDVMTSKMYRDFKTAMENAYKDTSKE